ncbi:MAG: GNAT family N-acetyltransferase [Streptosporangiales bacterium]|nr:GNAT family N-acetyltransferase [Streptosporangiales bacterium]
MAATGAPRFTWRRVVPADFPLLAKWLAEPHIARWWNHETAPDAVERDFGPTARGEEASEDLLAVVDGQPVGLVQRSRLIDYPQYLADFAGIVEVPEGTVTIDYLLAGPDRVGKGLGSAMIAAIVARTWHDFPTAPAVLVAVVAANRASWRALEKAGATRAGTGDLEPDNPIDDRKHYVYRFDRPA